MPLRKESPKSVFRRLPRNNLAKFKVNVRGASESTKEFLARNRITSEEMAWTQRQPVYGPPSLRRLRAGLTGAGFADIWLKLSEDRADIKFRGGLTARVTPDDSAEKTI